MDQQDPNNSEELSVEELESVAGGVGGEGGTDLPTSDINENGCSGGNCNC